MKSILGVLMFSLLPMTGVAQTKVRCSAITDASVPITAAGNYCLVESVVGRGLTIDADDVVLDLRGFSIINDGTATQPMDASGKVAGVLSRNRNNITVRNGTIRGFDYGVHLGFPAGVRGTLLVEDLLVLNSRSVGISALVYETAIIRNNTVSGVSGNTARGIGIRGRGDAYNGDLNLSDVSIEGNRVSNVRGAAGNFGNLVFGILIEDSANAAVARNLVLDVYRGAPTGQAFAIDARVRLPNTVSILANTAINSVAEAETFGIGMSHSMGTPVYDGPIGLFGSITTSRVYNFETGISASASIMENGKPKALTTCLVANNVVSGARAGRAFMGGKKLPNNRSE